MSQSPSLKRKILREAIDENLSSIEGKPREHRRLLGASRRPLSRTPWLILLAVLVLASVLWLRETGLEHQPVSAAGEPAPRSGASGGAAFEDPASQLVFPAPRAMDPGVFSFDVRRITLDPGHGGDDHGTTSDDLTEKELTLDIALRLRDRLEADSFEVLLTREEDRFLSLRDRSDIANRAESDLFVSIHINWLSARQIRGVETYYLGPTDDPELTALARLENRQSGYTLAEMRGILERIYTDFLQLQSRQLASRVQRSLHTSLLPVNPELRNRGVKTAPFVVLVSAEMPAILAEVSCLSNAEEVELLSRPLYREHIADALAKGIRRYAGDVNQTEEKESDG